jgi:hypothetical protein
MGEVYLIKDQERGGLSALAGKSLNEVLDKPKYWINKDVFAKYGLQNFASNFAYDRRQEFFKKPLAIHGAGFIMGGIGGSLQQGELVFENNVLTDHPEASPGQVLGCTRVVLQEDPEVFTIDAGFEPIYADQESELFIGYDEVVRISADMLNHTPGEESSYAMRLSGGYGENIGLAKSISVMPDDTVRMEVYGKYIDIGEAKQNPAVMAVLMAIIAADPVAMGVDGGLNTSMNTIDSESGSLAGLLTSKKEIGDAPPAFLNYLFFAREMNYKYDGFVQMSNAAREDGSNVYHERLAQEVVSDEAGYFYIYLSNDSQTGSEAFFDDFTIMTSESYIVQQTDYYPYGMIAKNWTRVGEKATNDLFQGKTYEDLTKWGSLKSGATFGKLFGLSSFAYLGEYSANNLWNSGNRYPSYRSYYRYKQSSLAIKSMFYAFIGLP